MQQLSCLKLPAKLENLPQLIETVRKNAGRQGLDDKKLMKIELASEEAIVNIINHSYPSEIGEVKVSCLLDENGYFMVQIEDEGIPFDTLSYKNPNPSDNISERQLGGIGIMLMKKLIKNIGYQRKDNKNVLTLTIRI